MRHLLCIALIWAGAASQALAEDPPPPPTRIDPRLITLSGADCAHPGIPQPLDGRQSFGADVLGPAVAMEVYDALTAALDEAGRDKERVSTTVLNLSTGQPICFQVALRPEAWRSSMERNRVRANFFTPPPVPDGQTPPPVNELMTTDEQIRSFPFFAEFYIRRDGGAISVGVSTVRYREAIWRNFQSPANNIVATLVFSRPGDKDKQTLSVPLGGPTGREDIFYRYDVPAFPEVEAMQMQQVRQRQEREAADLPTTATNAQRDALAARHRQELVHLAQQQEAQRRLRMGGTLPRGAPQTAWFTSPFSQTQTAGEPPTAMPVSISIQLRELKDGNPVAAGAAGVLTAIRGGVQTSVSPTARAQAEATQRTAEIASITAYNTALTAYINAHNAYCATGADLAALAPTLYSTHVVLLQYVQAGMGQAPPYPMVDVYNPNRNPCPAPPPPPQ